MGGVFSSKGFCFGVGKARRSGCKEYHDNGSYLEVPLSSSSFYRSSSEHSYEPEQRRANLPVCSRLVEKGNYQTYTKKFQSSSVLFQTFLSSQRSWENSTDHRPVFPQQVIGNSQIQDGISGQDCEEHIRSHVGHVGGHHRCLSSCPYRLGISCLLCLCVRRRDLCLSGPSIRAILCSMDILQSHKAGEEIPSFLRSAGFIFLGRLLDFGCVSPFDGCLHQINDRPSSKVRLQNKLGEVFHYSTTTARISGCHSRSSEPHAFSPSGENRQDYCLCEARSESISNVQTGSGETSGFLKFHRRISSSGSTLSDSCNRVDEFPHINWFEGSPDPFRPGSERRLDSMVRYGSSVYSSAHASPSPISGDHDGCIKSRLEWLAFARRSVWFMGTRRSGSVYKLERVEGCPFDSPSFFISSEGAVGEGSVRQLYGCGLYTPSGLCGFSFTLGTYKKYFGISGKVGHHFASLSPKGCTECPSRQGFQVGTHFYRMVFGSSVILGYLRLSRLRPRGGPLRHSIQLSIAYFCFSVPRPSVSGSGCIEFGLEQVEDHLSFSTGAASSGGVVEIEALLREGVPSGSQESIGSHASVFDEEINTGSSSSSGVLSVSTDRRRNLLHERTADFYLEPCRMEAIVNGYTLKGYGANSIRILLELHRESTIRQYQVAWTLFLGFLEMKGTVHQEIGLPDVFEFLAHYHELGRAYYTIAVYRCALKLPLRLLLDLSLDGDDSDDFMKGLYNARPPPKPGSWAPTWALSDLLHYLASDTFEPLADKSLRVVTKKALALVLLATGRRIDDVAAFTRFYRTEGSSLRMTVPASHMSKNEKKGHVPEDATVLQLVSPHPSDMSLCPVCALQIYFKKRNEVVNRANDWRLWMHSKTILSYMISSLIIEARVVAGRSDDVRCGPHHLRKFAASYCKANWESSYQQVLYKRMGSKSMSVLSRDYINLVDPLSVSCVVPMGTIVVPPP